MQVSNLDGLSWTAPAFNDGAWPDGPGLLAHESNPAITSLINTPLIAPATATNNAAPGHAYYFRKAFNLTHDLSGYTITASAYVDDAAVFYINGTEVVRLRMPEGTVTSLTFATGQPPGGDALNPDTFTIPASRFVPGMNVIAVEVHQNQAQSSDITFGLRLDADWSGAPPAPATPGEANSVAGALPAFPDAWLNEVQADNGNGPLDNAGQHEPWVELYNPGSNTLDLAGYALSGDYANPGQWSFPPGASIPAGGFLVVWCDGETNQTTAGAPHANFRLGPGGGQVGLSRDLGQTWQLVDYLTYAGLPANWSYGDIPDAQPFHRGNMFFVTPGATNNPASPPITIFINEWMAENSQTLADPADGGFEDWFELFNPGTNTVDLGGFFLTDDLSEPFEFRIPDNGHYLVPPGGFLLVWADGEDGQNSTNRGDLHADFSLNRSGEAIGLFAADGTQIDAVTFGAQVADVAEGRYPDGAPPIFPMPTPTPRAVNSLPNTAPTLMPIPDQSVTLGQTLSFAASASDPDWPAQTLAFRLGDDAPPGAVITPVSGVFTWTPDHAPDTNQVSITVQDDGIPSLSATATFQVIVHLPPTIAVQMSAGQMQLFWPRGTLQEADEVTGPFVDVTSSSPLTVDLSEARKFYRVRL